MYKQLEVKSGYIPSVCVCPSVKPSLECFATETRKWPLTCVNHHAFFQLTVQCKGFAANLAHERPQLRMLGFAVSALVTHATVFTPERPFVFVLNHVSPELRCALPSFTTGVTVVWLLPRLFIPMPHWACVTTCVSHHMHC